MLTLRRGYDRWGEIRFGPFRVVVAWAISRLDSSIDYCTPSISLLLSPDLEPHQIGTVLDNASGIRFYQFHPVLLDVSLTFPLRVESTRVRLPISMNHSGRRIIPSVILRMLCQSNVRPSQIEIPVLPISPARTNLLNHTLVCPSVDLKYAYVVFHQLPSYERHTLGGVYQVPHL